MNAEDKKIKEAKLKSVIYHLCATLKQIAILIRPLMKDTSDEILRQLGLSNDIEWSDLDNYYDIHNAKVIEKGEPIFVRLNVQEEINYIQGLMKK